MKTECSEMLVWPAQPSDAEIVKCGQAICKSGFGNNCAFAVVPAVFDQLF
ncbi:hypothetical protein [Candidatus Rhodobacter oscarellae]|nr:hypothetical protein [Candidatus Rhodobacter lobularis]